MSKWLSYRNRIEKHTLSLSAEAIAQYDELVVTDAYSVRESAHHEQQNEVGRGCRT